MCFSDFPVPLVPLWSRTLRTLQRYSGEWAPLPSELSGTCLYRYIYIYILSHALRKPPPCPIPNEHCAGGLCRCMCRCRRSSKRVFGTIWGAFCSILHARGTTFGALGTCFETPFPRFGQMLDFRRLASRIPHSPGHPFFTLGVTFSLCGVSEAENKCFFGQPGLRPHFGTISGQILGF